MARSALPTDLGRSYPRPDFIWDGRERAGEREVADAQLPRRLGAVEIPCLQASDQHRLERVLLDRLHPRWQSQPPAPRLGPVHPGLDLFCDQLAFHLGHCREDREHQPPR